MYTSFKGPWIKAVIVITNLVGVRHVMIMQRNLREVIVPNIFQDHIQKIQRN